MCQIVHYPKAFRGYAGVQEAAHRFEADPHCHEQSPQEVGRHGNRGECSQMSSRAQMLMAVMGCLNALMTGDFGSLMNMLGQGARQMPVQNPGFGQPRETTGGPPCPEQQAPQNGNTVTNNQINITVNYNGSSSYNTGYTYSPWSVGPQKNPGAELLFGGRLG